MQNPFRYFNSSPEVIRLTVMMYVRYPLSLAPGRSFRADQR
jgi:putative transposase